MEDIQVISQVGVQVLLLLTVDMDTQQFMMTGHTMQLTGQATPGSVQDNETPETLF